MTMALSVLVSIEMLNAMNSLSGKAQFIIDLDFCLLQSIDLLILFISSRRKSVIGGYASMDQLVLDGRHGSVNDPSLCHPLCWNPLGIKDLINHEYGIIIIC